MSSDEILPSSDVGEGPRVLLAASFLALFTLLAFLPALDAGFVNYDDPLYATETPWDGIGTAELSWAIREFHVNHWHPLTVISHMLDRELFGLNPRGHHLTSLLIHCANAVLLFLVLFRLTTAYWRSLLAAALHSVHPLRVESVVWVSERKDVLSLFFGLLALLVFVRWVRERSFARYLAALLLFACALMAKAMLITLPAVLLLLDVWPLGRLELRRSFPWRKAGELVLEKVPFFLLSLGATAIAFQSHHRTRVLEEVVAPWGVRVANAVVATASYVRDAIAPFDLAVVYPFPESIPTGTLLLAAGVVALLLVAVGVSLHRAPWVGVGVLWFLGTLVPVIGLVKVGNLARADRYTYLPGIGLALIASWGLAAWVGTETRRRYVAVAFSLLAVSLLAVGTRAQARLWQDSETLFRHTLNVTSNNHVAHLNLADALRLRGDVEEAVEHYRASLAILETPEAYGGLAEVHRQRGELDLAETAARKGLEVRADDPRLLLVLGSVLDRAGRSDEARDVILEAARVAPNEYRVHWALADLAARAGDLDAAIDHARRATELAPDPTAVREVLIALLLRAGRQDEAQREIELRRPPAS